MRVAILWTELSGYMNACLKTLVARYDVELIVFRIVRPNTNRKYDDQIFEWIPHLFSLPQNKQIQLDTLLEHLNKFQPDVIVVSGWAVPSYIQICKIFKKSGSYIISGCDNQWRGTLRQWIASFFAKQWLHSIFNALWVPGERAEEFARRLGFNEQKILRGIYSCDRRIFVSAATQRFERQIWPNSFTFIGRLVEEKGIADLIQAYKNYYKLVEQPWKLQIAGIGPLESLVHEVPGVSWLGFLQPIQCAATLVDTGAFILPSYYEPWGVVIHEATSAALPILCTYQCGSSADLVRNGFNGYLFEAGDVSKLTALMLQISSPTTDQKKFGHNSLLMSEQFTPEHWANVLINHVKLQHKPLSDQNTF